MTSELLKNYDACEETLRKLYDSRLRLAILDALSKGPMRLADLRREVNSNAPNTSSKAKELEDAGLVERAEGDYKLTAYGETTLRKMSEVLKFHSAYEKFAEFWSTHNIGGLPKEFQERIGELNDGELWKTGKMNVSSVHDRFIKLINSTNGRFYGVSPLYHPEYIAALIKNLVSGVDTKLVFTSDVAQECARNLKLMHPDKRLLALLDSAEFYEYPDHTSVAMAITADELFFGLQKNDNTWIADISIYSKSPAALQWGLDLFEYYKKLSKPIKFSDYL